MISTQSENETNRDISNHITSAFNKNNYIHVKPFDNANNIFETF